jgi:hypothetical protein
MSQCITLHYAITKRLDLDCDMLELLDRIKRTLQWQLHRGLISCDLRPPNVIAFTSTLLDMVKDTDDASESMMHLEIEDDEAPEDGTQDWRAWLEHHQGAATAFAGSFPCEKGPLVWTLIDYGLCIVQGGCTTFPDKGAAWDLIKRFVGGKPGEREDVSMDPNVWFAMLCMAVCQLQASVINGEQA